MTELKKAIERRMYDIVLSQTDRQRDRSFFISLLLNTRAIIIVAKIR